jgi:hypothetical protein
MNTHEPSCIMQDNDEGWKYNVRPVDEPELASPSLLTMCELDSLRAELRKERYQRMLLEGEIARMKYEQAYPPDQSFLGFQLRSYDSSDDDCERTSYECKIDGVWCEVVTSALRFDPHEAVATICQILKNKVK